MKKLFILLLVIATHQVKAEVELVPLNMELGYWETTSEMDIEAMLASIPESQRETIRAMMSSRMKIPVVKQCITQDSLNNMEKQMKESFKSAGNDCDLKVNKSTSEEFSGVLTCAGGATTMTISTKSINSKRIESQVIADMGAMGKNNITTIGEWKAATCPEGIK
ncbi:DUF3617 family protein [uncultured Paraglaciecola sp.]|uniref:DUF3617 family protein n=1 Tax=uncultured Paraglaciecola sp. TaxID=1765024 RepID=UPI0030DDCC85|tara:strand:+ start:146343 stop:146837 length:495 start_codon:yes stop_codon:yes gene_type:complete